MLFTWSWLLHVEHQLYAEPFEGADTLHVELRNYGRMSPVAQGYLAWGDWIAEKEVTTKVPIASSNEIDSDAMSTLDLQCLCNLVTAVQAEQVGVNS